MSAVGLEGLEFPAPARLRRVWVNDPGDISETWRVTRQAANNNSTHP